MTAKSGYFDDRKPPSYHYSKLPVSRALVISVTVVLVLVQTGCENQVEELKPAQYVKRQTCISCHEEQYTEWSGSHHDLAMQVASEQTVLGHFNDAPFTHFGVTSKFFKKDGKFFVHTDGPDGKMSDFEVKYTFGFDPLQQYLIEFPDGRMQALDIAWDSHPKEQGGQRWFHLHPDEEITYDDILHWTGLYLNWNYMCAECHSTNLQKNFNLKTNTFNTTWSEINVGCQACHGPGSNHVEWAYTRVPTTAAVLQKA